MPHGRHDHRVRTVKNIMRLLKIYTTACRTVREVSVVLHGSIPDACAVKRLLIGPSRRRRPPRGMRHKGRLCGKRQMQRTGINAGVKRETLKAANFQGHFLSCTYTYCCCRAPGTQWFHQKRIDQSMGPVGIHSFTDVALLYFTTPTLVAF